MRASPFLSGWAIPLSGFLLFQPSPPHYGSSFGPLELTQSEVYRLVRDAIKSTERGLPELAWAVIGWEQTHDQDSLNTQYQQKLNSHNVD